MFQVFNELQNNLSEGGNTEYELHSVPDAPAVCVCVCARVLAQLSLWEPNRGSTLWGPTFERLGSRAFPLIYEPSVQIQSAPVLSLNLTADTALLLAQPTLNLKA